VTVGGNGSGGQRTREAAPERRVGTKTALPGTFLTFGLGRAFWALHSIRGQKIVRLERPEALREVAATYAATIVEALKQEYPNDLRHLMTGPDDRPTPREIHPAFYGCFDWHSCVEMHWALVRLLRLAPDLLPDETVRAMLDEHLTAQALITEAAYVVDHPGFKRPYGWGWALMLTQELSTWDDPDAQRWAANIRPLADTIAELFVAWLPRATYPNREGTHVNSAFGLVRAMPFATARADDGEPVLLDGIDTAARRWFSDDTDYPAGWEPNGADFLSPTLSEAELMSEVLEPPRFAEWFDRFLPGLTAGRFASLFRPCIVSDPTDGQIAHLHGLNLYRAYAWQRLAAALPDGDPRGSMMQEAARRHADASLRHVCGSDYMLEHWLACYAVLLLT
jgi:hypothetical protein